jgi:hypothetical protein
VIAELKRIKTPQNKRIQTGKQEINKEEQVREYVHSVTTLEHLFPLLNYLEKRTT